MAKGDGYSGNPQGLGASSVKSATPFDWAKALQILGASMTDASQAAWNRPTGNLAALQGRFAQEDQDKRLSDSMAALLSSQRTMGASFPGSRLEALQRAGNGDVAAGAANLDGLPMQAKLSPPQGMVGGPMDMLAMIKGLKPEAALTLMQFANDLKAKNAPMIRDVAPGASLTAIDPNSGTVRNIYTAPERAKPPNPVLTGPQAQAAGLDPARKWQLGDNNRYLPIEEGPETFRIATPDEIAAAHLPPGTSAKVNTRTNDLSILNKGYSPLSSQEISDRAALTGAETRARVGVESEGAQSLDDDAKDYIAQQYIMTGNLPPLGMGKDAAKMRQQIISRASQIEKETGATGYDAVQRHVETKTIQTSLNQVSKTRNMVEAFEQTALKGADLALSLSAKGGGQYSAPVINRWTQAGRKALQGDADVAAFDAALTTFKNEYAKIMSGATGAAGSTDSARAEADALLSKAYNADQLKSTIAVMKRDMGFRIKALKDQENGLKARLGAGLGRRTPTPAPANAPALTGNPRIDKYLREP